MKKTISVWSFPFDWSLERKLALAREAGFAGFEVDLTENGPVALNSSAADLATVRRQFDAVGLVPSGLATGLYWGANAASADPNVRTKAEQILRAQIRCAQGLGIDAILVVPGAVGVDFIPGGEVVPYADAYDRALDFVRRLSPVAADAGVSICVENVWNKFLLSPLEFRGFVDAAASPAVGAYFDAGNALLVGYPEHWIQVLGSRIRRVHFKDYRRAVGSVDGFCDLLSGDVDWPAVMRALRAVRYNGWIGAEMIPPVPFYKHCPEVLIHNTSRALDAILALGTS